MIVFPEVLKSNQYVYDLWKYTQINLVVHANLLSHYQEYFKFLFAVSSVIKAKIRRLFLHRKIIEFKRVEISSQISIPGS